MIVKLLTENHLECLSLKGGYRGSSESTLVEMSNCLKSHATAQMVWMKMRDRFEDHNSPCSVSTHRKWKTCYCMSRAFTRSETSQHSLQRQCLSPNSLTLN